MADAPLYLNQPEAKKDNDLLCCGCFAVFLLLMLIGGLAIFGSFGDNPNENTEGTPRYGQQGAQYTANEDCIDKINKKAKKWLPYVLDAASKYGGDPALMLAQLEAESDFKPKAQSNIYRDGKLVDHAQGIAQFVPGTWSTIKSQYDVDGNKDGKEDVWTGEDGIYGQAAYNKYILEFFAKHNVDQSIDNLLAAYNAGEGAVQKYGGVPPYPETISYVARIKALYNRYKKCIEVKPCHGGTIVDIARAELAKGPHENPSNHVIYKDGTVAPYNIDAAWCARFVTWVLEKAGYKIKGTNWAPDLYNNLKSDPNWQYSSTPVAGAVVFYGGHIGLVESVNSDGTFNSIEGNIGPDGAGYLGRLTRSANSAVGFVYPKEIKSSAIDCDEQANTQSSTEVAILAKEVMDLHNQGKLTLTKKHDQTELDGATAYDNIGDLMNGKKAKRSSGRDGRLIGPGGETNVSPEVLQAIINTAKAGHKIVIEEIAGGKHSPGSKHFSGRAVDIDGIDGLEDFITQKSKISDAKIKAIAVELKKSGPTNLWGPSRAGLNSLNNTHNDHIHVEW